MRNTRSRAAVVACLAAVGCMAMSVDPPPASSDHRGDLEDTAADRAVAQMRARVRAEEAALRASLDAAEATQDWSELRERKRSTDGWLSPMHLVRDVMHGAIPGAECEPLAAWRVEWRDEGVHAAWTDAEGAERVRRSLDAWVPRPGSDEVVRIAATTSGERWVGCDAPATCAWTVDGSWGVQGPVVHGRCWWRFPLAERVRVDLPLAGDGMDLWWDDRGARYQDDHGAFHQEAWPPRPIFCNPPTIFAAFDSLRAAAAPDARSRADRVNHPDRHAARGACTRTVRRPDGSVVRTDRWEWNGDTLRELRVRIGPLRLVHHAERAFRLGTEVQGEAGMASEHRPTSEIEEFTHGCEVVLAFRPPLHGVDAVRPGVQEAASVPDTMDVLVSGEPVTRVRFEHVRLGRSDTLDAFETAAIELRRVECEAHRTRADALERAIESSDDASAMDAVAAVVRRHEAEASGDSARADELELIGERLASTGLHASAAKVRGMLANAVAVGTLRPRARGVPCEAPDTDRTSDGPSEPPGAGVSGVTTTADPCARSGEGVLRLARCASDAIGAAGAPGAWGGCIGRALCADASIADASACDDATAHRIARDLADALRAGAIVLSDDGEPESECAMLAAAVVDASRRGPVDPHDRARAHAGFDAACEGVRRALRASLADAGVAPAGMEPFEAAFEQLATIRRAVIGNPFAGLAIPASDRLRDPFDCLAAAEGDAAIRRAVVHELGRCRALEAGAGETVGAVRRRAAHRRVASAGLDAAIRAMETATQGGRSTG